MRESLSVFKWSLGLAGADVGSFTCCMPECEMRVFSDRL